MTTTAAPVATVRPPGARPPGPRGWPLLGVLPEYTADPLGVMLRAAHTYGDVLAMRLFIFDVYQVNRPDLVEQVLRQHAGDVVKDFFTRALAPVTFAV